MKSTNIVIVNYGMGNLHSIARAVNHVSSHTNIVISSKKQDIEKADKIILPGQGAMRDCMLNLKNYDLLDSILNILKNKPLFGICVGQQMLFSKSEEGDVHCLNFLPGIVKHFRSNNLFLNNDIKLKVPHMGWNTVQQNVKHHMWKGIPNNEFFYFIHSYYVIPEESSIIASTSSYGITFASAIIKDNVFATQFHPEKSSNYGLMLYKNFIEWQP
ncbi:Imidazole glycerol phosphate synthase subunit HisH [Candidatus Kinetoplastibacterium sorsogonicusi]|uniref:Imidazole glycerol phosphate synthase subunit HisH n=1 Tax=Candidatus Kinetoplastidibacterium kentomonadis TaxID=1576550 RepID=A0A3S7J911_9PROT|nr:imidazole glycerol phosphate synthase subunit HisH [Candidatus Kinetoplastibacterium sorsogonicusi]AWD32167.1 Imidazole glycerol phosphate synthase subunit HisH [Candidatus Kinetoplastibacterium sorsogonicusi]